MGASTHNTSRVAVYAGSFDPVTIGHVDIVRRTASIFDLTYVAIGRNLSRKPLLTLEERLVLLQDATSHIERVIVASFDGLLVDFCVKVGASTIVRGLRTASDFEHETKIAHANADIAPSVDTLFLPSRTEFGFVSASLVREIASHRGDVSRYVSPAVCESLARKLAK